MVQSDGRTCSSMQKQRNRCLPCPRGERRTATFAPSPLSNPLWKLRSRVESVADHRCVQRARLSRIKAGSGGQRGEQTRQGPERGNASEAGIATRGTRWRLAKKRTAMGACVLFVYTMNEETMSLGSQFRIPQSAWQVKARYGLFALLRV